MPVITPQTQGTIIDTLTTEWSIRFGTVYEKTEQVSPRFATTLPSGTKQNAYAWLDLLSDGSLREWVGERQRENLSVRDYLLTNKKWERTLRVKREDIEDDQYGVYAPRVDRLARGAKVWPDVLCAELLKNGASTDGLHNCFDGKPFFSTTHPLDIDNSSTAAANQYANYASTGVALTSGNFAAKRAVFESQVGRDGVPLNLRARVLMVPPALRTTAENILNTTFVAPATGHDDIAATGASENTLKGAANIVVNPYLTETTAWYIFDDQMEIMPLIFQLRSAPELTPRVDPQSPNVFDRDEYEWGVRARGVGGYTLPQLMHKYIA